MFDFSNKVVIVAEAAMSANASPDCLLLEGVDLTDEDAAQRMVSRVVEQFGWIDVLANTVGGFRAGNPLHETPLDTFEFMLALNARTAFILGRAVVPVMLRQGSGKIIHTAAPAGLQGRKNSAAYSASKAAVIRLTESMAAELKASGINVNCILPGTIDTPQNREAMPQADFSKWVSPEALADVFLFLASDAARAIHGAAVPVLGLT
jgi:NAD(P)-dependent dehydrogenase (short-subunit alcohol dehydrogenase family)